MIKFFFVSGFSLLIVCKVCVLYILNSWGVFGFEYGYMLFMELVVGCGFSVVCVVNEEFEYC